MGNRGSSDGRLASNFFVVVAVAGNRQHNRHSRTNNYNNKNNSSALLLATRTQAKTIDAFVRRPNGGLINSKAEQLLGFTFDRNTCT